MNLIVLLGLVGIGAVLASGTNIQKVVTATVGESVRLDYDYNGPRSYIRFHFFKDRQYFRADGRRTFKQLGKIYFSKVTLADAGTYQMIVKRRYVFYNKAIVLKGKNQSCYCYKLVYKFKCNVYGESFTRLNFHGIPSIWILQ